MRVSGGGGVVDGHVGVREAGRRGEAGGEAGLGCLDADEGLVQLSRLATEGRLRLVVGVGVEGRRAAVGGLEGGIGGLKKNICIKMSPMNCRPPTTPTRHNLTRKQIVESCYGTRK